MSEQPLTAVAACAGKGFEHHEEMRQGGSYERWECALCGDRGDFADFYRRMMPLRVQLDRLQQQMLDPGAAILLPSEAEPGPFGKMWGRDVFRVRGIAEPMVTIPARGV